MATGKSTVGRLLAKKVGRPFVDLDERITGRLGMSIKEYFAREGESAFRAVEQSELLALFGASGLTAPVVALGAGALLGRETRLHVLERAVVVALEAKPAEVARRAGSHSGRPLLEGPNAEQRAATLLAERALVYAESHARVATDGRRPEAVAEDVLAVWQRNPIAVAAGASSYAVEVGRGIVAERLGDLARGASQALLVTDENVVPRHGPVARAALSGLLTADAEVVLTPGEIHKHIGSVERIWRTALNAGCDRKSVFVGLGGGVATDITGFAAASFMRGVRWLGVPTTLLAMVDASVGGKTGVDLDQAKNAVGAFHQPSGVLCDTELEATEPERGYVSALAEVVKTAVIGDPAMLDLLEREAARVRARDQDLVGELVRRSISVKARIVSMDERESGLRAVLNLGHTVGHALESHAGLERLTHGEAVSLGLVAALRIGQTLGHTPAALGERVTRLLGELGLPVDLSREPLREAAELLGHDKKRAGKHLKFVVAYEPGRVDTVELELSELRTLTHQLALLPQV
jgi:shikimate kinase / 3-dehydroquinate synthase